MTSKRKKYWGNNPRFKVPKSTPSGSNRFQMLSDLEDDDVSSVEKGEIKEDAIKIPPIIVDNSHNFTTVIKLLGASCKFKRISIGTKILPNSLLEYDEIVKKLKNNQMKFFSHPMRDNQKFKLMLFGLPQLGIDTIKNEFKDTFNIELVNIKEIKTSRSNLDDALYMLEFNRNQITKREVIKIKYVYGIVIHWRNPLRRSRGPTQCSKCAMYGHGSANCFRAVACLGCGGAHDYSNCQLNKTNIEGPVIYKCFNCIKRNLKSVNHRADDPHCPSRKEYLDIRLKVTNKRKPASLRRPTYTDFYSSEDEHPDARINEILPKSSQKRSGKIDNHVSYATMASSIQRTDDNDNLSNEKILDIYFEALDALEKCKTKYDKMRVLGNMLRHVI